jgi:3-hydroxyisobutyrate dehydrogenase-like beta-hydroxyacid dehydrogenase
MVMMARAVDMAKQVGIDPKRFRAALRKENFAWHKHNDRWTVVIGSFEHAAMERVLREISS